MTEVRNEVIVATAVLISALIAVIGYQALNPAGKKAPFMPKKATCAAKSPADEPPKEQKVAQVKVAQKDVGGTENRVGGRVLEE